MSYMFYDSPFNQDISKWDLSNKYKEDMLIGTPLEEILEIDDEDVDNDEVEISR